MEHTQTANSKHNESQATKRVRQRAKIKKKCSIYRMCNEMLCETANTL